MKIGTIHKLLATSALVCAASASQAATVDNWGFVLDMHWDTSAGATKFDAGMPGTTPGIGMTSVSATEISWGAIGGIYYNTNPDHARSGIGITRPHVTGNITTSVAGGPVSVVAANMFSHYNSAITGTFQTLTQATLDLSVQLVIPGTSDVAVNLTKSFDVHFYETPNVGGTCAWGVCDSDIFAVVSGMDLSSTFTYAGQQYTLNYFDTGGQRQALSSLTCQTMGFSAGACYGFTTPESARTDVMFNFSLTTAVPEPETYAMLLAGLGIVGAVARRRRNAIRS
jgi:hypothetical protein